MSETVRTSLPDGRSPDRPVYIMRLRAEPGINETQALRALLKVMLRRFGLRCLAVTPENG